jgi:hypothetical protein
MGIVEMTGYQSKKALSDRMADAKEMGLFDLNEWQLGLDESHDDQHSDEANIAFQLGAEWQRNRMKARIEQLTTALRDMTKACDCWDAVNERRRATEVLEGKAAE